MKNRKERLYLKPLKRSDGERIYEMLQEIEANDNGFNNEVKGKSYESYKDWLYKNEQYSKGEGLEDKKVPQTTYWMYSGEVPVGYGRIRHRLNDTLEASSGHVGYALPKSQRGNGYGDELLKLLIKECFKMGILPIQVGVNKENKPSNAIVLRNGGTLYKQTETKNIYHISH